jgi:TRAP-type mannitol/chloroaromatic compound transport system permease small subunit
MIEKYIYYMDKTSDWVGKIACWIIVPLVLGTVYDVFMRYVFQAPTKWAYEMTWMEYGALFMLGGAYGLLHKLHVRVDVVFKNYPKRIQLWFDAAVYLFVFLPLFAILIMSSISFAAEACMIWEVSSISYWQPYIWPIKTLMPVVFILMFLQAVSELIKIAIHLKKGGDAV